MRRPLPSIAFARGAVGSRTGSVVSALLLVALLTLSLNAAASPGTKGLRSAQCPHSDRAPRTSTHPAAQAVLVPRGATGVLLCRYHSPIPRLHEVPSGLARSHRIRDRRTVVHLVREFDQAPPFSPSATSCPASDGSAIIAIFTYHGQPENPVLVELGACGRMTNGHLVRSALFDRYGSRLLRELRAYTGCPAEPYRGCDVASGGSRG
jgi:hypothetical protein